LKNSKGTIEATPITEKELTPEELLERQTKVIEKHREQMKNASAQLLEDLSSSDEELDDDFGDQAVDLVKKFSDTTFAAYNRLSGKFKQLHTYINLILLIIKVGKKATQQCF